MDSISIFRLYTNVLREDIVRNKIIESRIRSGVQDMARAYAPEINSLQKCVTDRPFTDFNNVAFRCAYLHKFAPLHTYIVLDVMLRILKQELLLFKKLVSSDQFKFCCLGGGPGSDAIGVLVALAVAFENFKSSATIIDSMKNWEHTFSSILLELRFGEYGAKWSTLHRNFQWSYIESNLLLDMTHEANMAVASASFITMVKFISAASCIETEPMVEKIFKLTKAKAHVLFIDNAAGGFTELILSVGMKNGFKVIFNVQHALYTNEDLKIERFGYTSCFETRVTILLLQKPGNRLVPAKKSRLQIDSLRQNIAPANMEKPSLPASHIMEISSERRTEILLSISNLQQEKKELYPQSNTSNQNITAFLTKKSFQSAPYITETSPERREQALLHAQQKKQSNPQSFFSIQNATASTLQSSVQHASNTNKTSPQRREESVSSLSSKTRSPDRATNNKSIDKSIQRVGHPVTNQPGTNKEKELKSNRPLHVSRTRTVDAGTSGRFPAPPNSVVQVKTAVSDTLVTY